MEDGKRKGKPKKPDARDSEIQKIKLTPDECQIKGNELRYVFYKKNVLQNQIS